MNDKQIKQITIKGFKSIKDSIISLKDINVFIGANGSGKSNFISIFDLLKSIIKKEFQYYILKNGGADTFLFNTSKETQEIVFIFEFGLNSYSFTLSFNTNDTLIFKSEDCNYNGSFKYNDSLGSGHLESLWDFNSEKNNIRKYVKYVLQGQVWRVYHFNNTNETSGIKKYSKVSNNENLLDDGSNIASFLYLLKTDYPSYYDNILRIVQIVAPYFNDFYLTPINNNEDIILKWFQVGVEKPFSASQLSDGTLRFICLATLFLSPNELLPETIIVDEPELGLHPKAISLLGEIIKKASKEKQIIISTQSCELLDEFNVGDIIVCDRNKDGSSVFKRLDEKELEEWLKEDYSLSDLWKKNLFGGRP